MKIVQVLNHFLPQHTAGTEVYVWSLCKHLQEMGCSTSVLIPNYGSTVSEKYTYDGIDTFMYAEPSIADRALITGQKISEGIFFFRQYLEDQQPDIVHFHEISGSNGISVAHLEVAKALGFKVIFTMHLAGATCNTGTLMYQQRMLCDGKIRIAKCSYCSLQRRTNNRFYASLIAGASLSLYEAGINTLKFNNPAGTILSYPFQIKSLRDKLKRIAAASDRIIPIADWYKDILLKNGVNENKLTLIKQALPVNSYKQENYAGTVSLPIKLVFIGRIDNLKGISILIDVVKEFNVTQVLVDIYGSATDQDFLAACKIKTADHPNIRWMGKIAPAEVLITLRQYHALVLPSMFSEMSPLVIQEAFAAGIPVIGSNVYGIAEQVKDGYNGLLFEMGSLRALKKILQQLISSPGILSKLAANVKPPRPFTEVAEETLNVYRAVSLTPQF